MQLKCQHRVAASSADAARTQHRLHCALAKAAEVADPETLQELLRLPGAKTIKAIVVSLLQLRSLNLVSAARPITA